MAIRPTHEDVAAARLALVALDRAVTRAAAVSPAVERRVGEGGMRGLFPLSVDQQVSLASAAAIWKRVEAGLDGEVTPEAVLARDVETLRTFGLSIHKARYAHEIARAQTDGRIDFDHLERLSDEEAVAALVAIKGIGKWTAETFLMFCEGRTDLFPAGDVALQEAMRWADGSGARPNEKAACARAEIWRPHRGVAAHLLWGWDGGVKRGEITLEDIPQAAESRGRGDGE